VVGLNEDYVKFPDLCFLTQNVLSLNISTKTNKTDLKILALTKQNSDIICLSDTRLNSLKQVASLNDLKKKFFSKGYNLLHNSKSSSRGVCILLKNSLNATIHREYRDYEDNYLLLDLTIQRKKFTLGAIYGPNDDRSMDFFTNLERDINAINNDQIIITGDWNCTWDSSGINTNTDVLNMHNIPSKRRSEKVNTIARQLHLTDPYRYLHPQKREFTFVPNIPGNRNRSRLDFFLISENLLDNCKSVSIPHCLASKLFDHKFVTMSFKKTRPYNLQKINDTVLKDPLLRTIIKTQTFDCYNNHTQIAGLQTQQNKDLISNHLGNIMGKISQILTVRNQIIHERGLGNNGHLALENRIDQLNVEITAIFNEIPDQEFFENLILQCENDIFFETLSMCLKNETLAFQSKFYAEKNKLKK